MNAPTEGENREIAMLEPSPAASPPRSWRESKWLIIVELMVVALIFVADAHHLIPVSKTPFLVVFAWISLRSRKLTWQRVGLSIYKDWATTVALGIAAGVL